MEMGSVSQGGQPVGRLGRVAELVIIASGLAVLAGTAVIHLPLLYDQAEAVEGRAGAVQLASKVSCPVVGV